MKKRELLVANVLILVIVIIFASFTFSIFSNQNFGDLIRTGTEKLFREGNNTEIFNINCSSKPKLNIESGDDESLKKLNDYQNHCNSFATDRLMFFTSFPFNAESAEIKSMEISNKLQNFYKNKIEPIVIVEPYVGDNEMEYRDFIDGMYDQALEIYFFNMRNLGVTDEMMGMWVPFPESNTPNWANKDTEPSEFAVVVNKYLSVLKRYFPNAEGSILLNATTYEPDDLEWNNGDYISLTPYLVDIDKRLVSSFGIQGFPWKAPANRFETEIFRATEFLQPDIAIAAAQELRTKDIWINTGSFYSKYTNDPERRVQVSLNDRKGILSGILDVAKYIKEYQLNEYRVKINLFSENKSEYQEATDWSYFHNKDSIDLLKEFLAAAEKANIPVSIFDR